MVFELCNIDVSSRCGSSLEGGWHHPNQEDAGDPLCKDEASFCSGSESGAGVSALIYQDENVVVRAITPANKPKRRFSLRRSFRRASSKEKQSTVEEVTEKTEGGIARRGSFRRGSFKRKSTKSENVSKEDRKARTLSLGREVRGPVEVTGTTDIQRCEGDTHTVNNLAPFATMPGLNGRQGNLSDQRDMTYDSGVETASSSFDPESRTTSVSSSGTLNSVVKQELFTSVKPGTIPPPPPPPPLPGSHAGRRGSKPDSTKRTSAPAISITDKKENLRRNHSADSRPQASSALMHTSKPTLLPSQFHPPPQSKPLKAPVPIPMNGRNGVKVPSSTFTESSSPSSHDSTLISATGVAHSPAAAVQDLNEATKMTIPTATRPIPDTNDLLLAIKRAVQQRRSLLKEGSEHNQPLDVAAILERRNVLSLSDDDTDGSNDEWD